MYEENEKRINWAIILKRLAMIIIALLVIFGIIGLITKCTRNSDSKKSIEPENVNLSQQLDQVQEATLKYLTKDILPVELNSSKTIKLKYLATKNLIGTVKDATGTVCDTSSSYSEVTRLENNYALKISLTCGKNTDYRIIYIGCFDTCKDGDICIGSENSTGGICNVAPTTENKDSNTSKENSNTTNTNNTNTNSNTNNNTKNDTNKTATNNNTNNNNNNNTNNKKTIYEYQKCDTDLYCDTGSLINGTCVTYYNRTYLGNVTTALGNITTKTEKVTYEGVPQYKTKTTTKTEEVCLHSSTPQDTDTVKYTYLDTDRKNDCYRYKKEVYTYSSYFTGLYKCGNTTQSSKTCVTTKKVKVCEDSSYTYNESTRQCTKTMVEAYTSAPRETTGICETTWSTQTSLGYGWIRTGNYKLQ